MERCTCTRKKQICVDTIDLHKAGKCRRAEQSLCRVMLICLTWQITHMVLCDIQFFTLTYTHLTADISNYYLGVNLFGFKSCIDTI